MHVIHLVIMCYGTCTGTLKPTIKEINTYVKNQYAVFWKDIAIELEMHYGKVEDIEKKCYDNETRICTVLYTWLDTSCNVSWKALEVAIINAQRIQEGLDPIEDLDGKKASVALC